MKRTVDVLVLEDGKYVRVENESGTARSVVVPGVEIELKRLFASLLG
jgi:hypothetical protein